jgi:hypothetical protein
MMIEPDAPDLWDKFNSFLYDAEVNSQEDLELFLQLTMDAAWDIPSALASICEHDIPETNHLDFFMHRNKYWDNDWSPIDSHFKEVHNLDLQSHRINWSFST